MLSEKRKEDLKRLWDANPYNLVAKRPLLKSMMGYTEEELLEFEREMREGGPRGPVKLPRF